MSGEQRTGRANAPGGTMPKKKHTPKRIGRPNSATQVRQQSPTIRDPSRRMAAAHSSKINLSAHHSYCVQTPATHNVKLLKHNQINLKYSPCRPSFKPLRLLYYKTRPPTGRKIALADAKGQTAQTPAKIENVDTRPIHQREHSTKSRRLHPQIPKAEFAKQSPLFAMANDCLLKICICI